MLYHLFRYLDEAYDLPGSGMFQYISFRAAAAIILSLLIVIIFGRSIIDFLRRKQIGEEIRDLGLQGQLQKKGTPTMGGVIILVAILVPMLLFGKLDNVYIQLLLVSTVWLGLIGGLDDYIKVFRHRKEGLKGRFKIVGQVGLGVIVGTTMWLSPDIVVREKVTQPVQTVYLNEDGTVLETVQRHVVVSSESLKTTQTTIPFVKNNEFDYGWLTGGNSVATWILYVLVAIFVVTAVSNGANLTDGLDGLATGVSVPIVAVLGVLAYLSGHIVYADYLNIMYIPGSGELVVFAAALAGALVGAALPYLFSGMLIEAVAKAARQMVEEVRRQFKEIKGILTGEAQPDYARCVEISTKGAQHEMVLPSVLAIIAPILTGLIFGVTGVVGLLISLN